MMTTIWFITVVSGKCYIKHNKKQKAL